MTLLLEYHAQIRQITGKSTESLELPPNATLRQAIDALFQQYGDDLRTFLATPDGELRPSIVLILGDRQVRWTDPAALKDGDHLLLLSPIAGG